MSMLVYVAGPYRAKEHYEVLRNIRAAEAVYDLITANGIFAYCPHVHTAFKNGLADDAFWLAHGLEMVSRCDAIVLTGEWKESKGSMAEKELAERIGIPVFDGIGECLAALTPKGVA